jgi:hypothetical protein
MRTRTVLTTLSVLATITLTGCGSSSGGSADAKLLSKAQLTSTLIALDDLGPGFKLDKDDNEDDDTDLGCLNGLDKIDKAGVKPARDEEISFAADSELSLPAVFSTVGTFRSEAKAAQVLHELSAAVADCKSIDVTDEDGFRIKLAVSSNTDEIDADATGQVNLEATGTGSTQGIEFPFGLRFSAIQVGNQVSVLGYVNSVSTLGDEADALLQRAFDRLAPVADGKKVPTLKPLNLKVVQLEDILGGGAA